MPLDLNFVAKQAATTDKEVDALQVKVADMFKRIQTLEQKLNEAHTYIGDLRRDLDNKKDKKTAEQEQAAAKAAAEKKIVEENAKLEKHMAELKVADAKH